MDSRGQFRTPIASTTATAIGLLAHIPPSIRGAPAAERYVGKYVGAAAVAVGALFGFDRNGSNGLLGLHRRFDRPEFLVAGVGWQV